MDKERKLSYEETHKKLVEAMQQACLSDEFDDYRSPDIDLSFLTEEPAEEKPKKRFASMSRFYKVATILIILLLVSIIRERQGTALKWLNRQNIVFRYILYWGAVTFIIFSLDITGKEFIYFQF